MKLNILKGLLACGILLSASACDENSWNDKYLDGFEAPDLNAPDGKVVISYTLTSADYKNIANMEANVAKAKADGVLPQLQAVGSQGYFTESIQPSDYIPAWMDSVKSLTNYPFYNLGLKATVRIDVKTSEDQPAEVTSIETSPTYEVSDADYQEVYGSTTDYIPAFSPAHTPEACLPAILASRFPNAEAGTFCNVTYNYTTNTGGSTVEPDPEPQPDPEPDMNALEIGQEYTFNGQLMAISSQGAVLTTSTGSALLFNKNVKWADFAPGATVTVDGKTSNYYGALQIGNVTVTPKGTGTPSYPEPIQWTGADVEAFMTEVASHKTEGYPVTPRYITVTGKLELNGTTYYNFTVDGATNKVAFWQPTDAQKAAVTDGETYTLTGYAVSTGKAYVNIIPTAINGTPLASAAKSMMSRAAGTGTEMYAVYRFDGSKWTMPDNISVLQGEDYEAMGQNSLTSEMAAANLPIWLKGKFPYVTAGAVKFVVFRYNSGSVAPWHCERFIYNGAEWTANTVETKMYQFVRSMSGNYVYDPTIYLDYPADRNNAESKAFYNACVQWVWNNIDVAELGMNPDKSTIGEGYVDSRDNQEYYGGASAYYNNYDNRLTTLKRQFGDNFNAFYGGMSEEEILALTQTRFCKQVARGAMETLFPDAMPGAQVDQYYSITFLQYSPSQNVTIRYVVTAPGKFEFVDVTTDGESQWEMVNL